MFEQNPKELVDNRRMSQGSDVTIFRGKGTPQEIKITNRMIQNHEKEGLKRRYFSFPEGTDIRAGDVLQIDGARDFWDILDVEDQIIGGELVQVKAIFEKHQPSTIKQSVPVPLALSHLHSEIQKIAGPLVAGGHFRQAIMDTFICLDNYVKVKSGIADNGSSLMSKAFSATSPILEISQDKEEQTGFMMLFMGAIKAVRNPYAHSLVNPQTPIEALEWLGFASILFRLADSATRKASP